MPFKSAAQERYMFSQHPEIAKRWAKETPNIKNLPEKVSSMHSVKKNKAKGKNK